MRRPCWFPCFGFSLIVSMGFHLALTQSLQAEEAAKKENIQEQAAAEKKEPQEKEPPQDAPKQEAPEKEQAPARPKIMIKKRAPLYELPVLKPRQLIKSEPRIAPHPAVKTEVKQKPAPKQLLPERPPNLPFWLPRQSGLSTAATYQLNSLGRHVQLNPATRFHLHRANGGLPIPPNQQIAPAAKATGQGAEKFYPGVSRLPPQKPFANVRPEPTGLQRYWPLLLEGREDPNTGLIIWTLP